MLKEMFKTISFKELPDRTTVVSCLLRSLDDYTIENSSVCELWSGEMELLLNDFKGERLVLDFSNVYIMTSRALSTLLALRFNAERRHIGFALCGLNDYIANTFRLTCLDHVFIHADDVEQVAALLRQLAGGSIEAGGENG